MALLEILEAPHPILSKIARPVREDEFGEALHAFTTDMAETMYIAPGVGLAAPQVGDARRILVADPGDEEDENGRRLFVVINPKILEHSKNKYTYEESCLSLPEYSLRMSRHKRIQLQWRDAFGKEHIEWFEDFASIVIQHEMDHLEGKTLLNHSSRMKQGRYIARQRKLRKSR